jgi:hypothetical protein
MGSSALVLESKADTHAYKLVKSKPASTFASTQWVLSS